MREEEDTVVTSSSEEEEDPLVEAVINWVGTFKNELGDDTDIDNFSQFNDGYILYRIVKAVTKDFTDVSKLPKSPSTMSINNFK